MGLQKYRNNVYAGVLGKILGVYLGRPVEGWTFEKIRDTFGTVSYYKNHKTGAPLIVPDDDISGTFAFFRALEDSGYKVDIKAEEIGNAWLNYIVENETILWWGGLCRSTEHTAYLRLKNGIKANATDSTGIRKMLSISTDTIMPAAKRISDAQQTIVNCLDLPVTASAVFIFTSVL